MSLQETEKDVQHPEFLGLILLFLPQNRQPLAGAAWGLLLPLCRPGALYGLCAAAHSAQSSFSSLPLAWEPVNSWGGEKLRDWVCHILSYTVTEVSVLAPHNYICKKKNQK